MYPERRIMVRQALRLGLVVTLAVFASSACGSGGGAKESTEEDATMKTVAGDGGSQLGDGGPATSAGFCSTSDVTLDASGNMYIADGGSIAADPAATPFGR